MSNSRCFDVVYSKDRNKKRKVFCDGKLYLDNDQLLLRNQDGEFIAKKRISLKEVQVIQEGETLELFHYEIQIERESKDGEDSIDISNSTHKEPEPLKESKSKAAGSERLHIGDADPSKALARPSHSVAPPRSLSNSCLKSLEIDHALRRLMKLHQVEACEFLFQALEGKEHDVNNDAGSAIRGAILADEMGLGKTLTSISVIWAYIRRDRCKCLVVCPSGLIYNWNKVQTLVI